MAYSVMDSAGATPRYKAADDAAVGVRVSVANWGKIGDNYRYD